MDRFGTGVLAGVPTRCCCRTGRLCRLLHRIFLGAIPTVIHPALLLGLLHMIGFGHMDLTAQQNCDRTTVKGIEHGFEDMERLQFVYQQRIFLFVARVLHALLEVVQLTKMLFPFIVDHIEQHAFLELFDHLFAVRLSRRFEVHGDVIYFLSVRDRNQDILVHLTLGLIHILDLRIGDLHEFIHTAFETVEGSLSQLFGELIFLAATELVLVKRNLNRKSLHHVELKSLVVVGSTGIRKNSFGRLVDHIRDIHTDTLSHQGVTTLCVDEVTLLVHHIVVFDQALTDTEVILLHFLLRPLDGTRYHTVLDHLTFLESHTVHDTGDAFTTEHTHQVVLQRYIENRTTRVTLTTGTTA